MKKSIKDIQVEGKKVLCRVDFNVPLEGAEVRDDTRIKAALPTITYLMEQGAKVILASHLGRPNGVDESLRLDSVAKHLSSLLGKEVAKANETVGPEAEALINQMANGDVLVLENVRFNAGEESNDPQFAKELAQLADVYVNDAFGAAHRAHASTEGVAQHLPAVAGFLMQKELDFLGKAIQNPERPFTAIIGGAKVKDKIGVIDNLLNIVDNLIICGGLSYTFIKAQGYEVGKSLLEADKLDLANRFMEKAKEKGVNLILPIDCVVADDFSNDATTQVVSVKEIPADWEGLDAGPQSVDLFRKTILDSKLVIWNGPAGVFELETFSQGTRGIGKAVADCNGTTIIGGGDSAAAVEKFDLAEYMTHISTGGGASLEFMEGKVLPGVEALNDK